MNTCRMPGFAAESSLLRARRQHVASGVNEAVAMAAQHVIAAESVPGGPGNVPSGYNRECKRVPYTVCVGNRCWTEYGWICTYTPLGRA